MWSNFPPVFLAQSIITIDSFFSKICCLHLIEPLAPHWRMWTDTSAEPSILGSLPSACPLSLSSHFLSCVLSNVFTLCSAQVTTSLLSSIVWHLSLLLVHSSLPAHSVATLSQTHPRLCQPFEYVCQITCVDDTCCRTLLRTCQCSSNSQ